MSSDCECTTVVLIVYKQHANYFCPTSQVVVELSRNKHHSQIHFVGEKDQAADRLWQTLCQADQWTPLTEAIVDNMSFTANGDESSTSVGLLDVADKFPWRIADQWLPTSNSGFVYLLVSTTHPEQCYVGTTQNISVRLNQHNRGFGAEGTACPDYIP